MPHVGLVRWVAAGKLDARVSRSDGRRSLILLAAVSLLDGLCPLLGCGGNRAPVSPVGAASASTTPSASPSAGPPSSVVDPSEDPPADQNAALARLLNAPWSARPDRHGAIAIPLPDAVHWTRVKYWGVTSLVGFRYGSGHHAVAAAFTFPTSPGDGAGAGEDLQSLQARRCTRRFRAWAEPLARDWDVVIGQTRAEPFDWPRRDVPKATSLTMAVGERHIFDVERRSLFGSTRYVCAFAAYPAWSEACLVVGFAIPEGKRPVEARALRDRLAREALPALAARVGAGPDALQSKTDLGT